MKKTKALLIAAALLAQMAVIPVGAGAYEGVQNYAPYYAGAVNSGTDNAANNANREAISGFVFYSVKNGSASKPEFIGDSSVGVYSDHEELDIPRAIKRFLFDHGLEAKNVLYENGVLTIDYNEFHATEIDPKDAEIREIELLATIYSCPLIKEYVAIWDSARTMKEYVWKGSTVPHYGTYTRTSTGFTLEYEDIDGSHKEEKKLSGVTTFGDGIPCIDDALILYTGSSTAINGGNKQYIDQENSNIMPVVIDGRTLVPVRYICEAFDGTVDWKELTKTVTIKIGRNDIKFIINKNNMIVNVASKPLDVPAQIIDGRTMVPLRALVEAIGKSVEYHDGLIVMGSGEAVEKVKSGNMDLIISTFYGKK